MNDLDSYAGRGVIPLVGLPKSDRLKGRGQTKQYRPSGRDANARFSLIAFLPGGLYVCTGVRSYDGSALCAFLWNGQVGVNPQDTFNDTNFGLYLIFLFFAVFLLVSYLY